MQITGLPTMPLEAADVFHGHVMPDLAERMADLPDGGSMVIVFDPADDRHKDWRLAAVRTMARACAPVLRFNAVVGTDKQAIDVVLAYLADAPGVTGQIFELDGAMPVGSLH